MNCEAYLKEVTNLIPLLTNIYIVFYGNEHANRIRQVINSTTFVVITNDESCQILTANIEDENKRNEKINYLNNKISDNPQLAESIKQSIACVVPREDPPIIILRKTDQLSLHTLIHEINHTLHNNVEELQLVGLTALLGGGKGKEYHSGLELYHDSTLRTFYELINEYMSYDLIEIFLETYPEYAATNSNIDIEFKHSTYLHVDDMVDNKIKELYTIWIDRIKELLITCQGRKLIDEFGKDNYEEIDTALDRLYYVVDILASKAIVDYPDIHQEIIYQKVKDKLKNTPEYNSVVDTIEDYADEIIIRRKNSRN